MEATRNIFKATITCNSPDNFSTNGLINSMNSVGADETRMKWAVRAANPCSAGVAVTNGNIYF
jgi:hypothetical protein